MGLKLQVWCFGTGNDDYNVTAFRVPTAAECIPGPHPLAAQGVANEVPERRIIQL